VKKYSDKNLEDDLLFPPSVAQVIDWGSLLITTADKLEMCIIELNRIKREIIVEKGRIFPSHSQEVRVPTTSLIGSLSGTLEDFHWDVMSVVRRLVTLDDAACDARYRVDDVYDDRVSKEMEEEEKRESRKRREKQKNKSEVL
jgi:hypothetical protein